MNVLNYVPYVPRGLSVLVLYVPRTLRALLPDVPCTLRTLVLYMLPCFVLPFSAGNFIITLNNTLFDERYFDGEGIIFAVQTNTFFDEGEVDGDQSFLWWRTTRWWIELYLMKDKLMVIRAFFDEGQIDGDQSFFWWRISRWWPEPSLMKGKSMVISVFLGILSTTLTNRFLEYFKCDFD